MERRLLSVYMWLLLLGCLLQAFQDGEDEGSR
jgi:hypothetical protein